MPSSDVRSSKTSTQNAPVNLSKSSRAQIFTVLDFAVLIFAFCLWVVKIAKIVSSILGTDQEQALHCILQKGKEVLFGITYHHITKILSIGHVHIYQGSVIMHLSVLCPTTPHQDRSLELYGGLLEEGA